MAKCSKCNRNIKGLPFRCRYCNKLYCADHRLPEDHNCEGLEKQKKYNAERWRSAVKDSVEKRKREDEPFIIPMKSRYKRHRKHKRKHKHGGRKRYHKSNFIRRNLGGIILLLIVIGILIYTNIIPLPLIDKCQDGTWYGRCSYDKPLYCGDGVLFLNASSCGCPYDYRTRGNNCEEIPKCNDGTRDEECSYDQPLYCNNTELVNKASVCGCPYDYIREEERCKSKYETGLKKIKLSGIGDYEVYKGLHDHLAGLDRSISYYTIPPTTKDFILKDLDNEIQKDYLDPLVDKIKAKSNDPDEQARIAIRMVQNIPYDWSALESDNVEGRYPYEVLYDMEGVCMEKANLMVFLLRELGFGVAIFEYDLESHRAVGIKCSSCDYKSSGYCFIESTVPTIPTDSEGDYVGAGKLRNPSEIIYISEGNSLDLSKECGDAQKWNSLMNKGEYLSAHDYNQWLELVEDYGIQVG